jgi:hypothetical protein
MCVKWSVALLALVAGTPAQRPIQEVLAAIDALAALETRPEPYERAVHIVQEAEFAQVALPLMQAMEKCRKRRGDALACESVGPRTPTPWLEFGLRPELRIYCTLDKLWFAHSYKPDPEIVRIVLAVLEDGSGGEARLRATNRIILGEVERIIPDIRTRLEKIAATDRTALIRAWACGQLATDAREPEKLTDLAFQITSTQVGKQAGTVLLATGMLQQLPRMSPAGRRNLIDRSFALLRKIDDGHGAGFALATSLGTALGVTPAKPGGTPFVPDLPSPGRAEPGERLVDWYQVTVDNALAWYEKHKDD